jgi:hypothetical protein
MIYHRHDFEAGHKHPMSHLFIDTRHDHGHAARLHAPPADQHAHAASPQGEPGHAPAADGPGGLFGGQGAGGGDLAHLLGQLPLSGGGIAVIPVDHLTINNNQLIENHLTENTSIVFNAAPGGTVDVGGNVNALSAQQLEVQSVSSSHAGGSELGWSDAAWGEAGGFEAVLFGHLPGAAGGPLVIMPVDHPTINNNTLVQNFEVENTNVVFNAAAGGTVDVGGDVNALGSQTGEIEHHAHDPSFLA